MRWNEYKDGDIRFRTFFLWWPMTIGYETRWLETVTIRESFCRRYSIHFPRSQWIPEAFDPPEYKENLRKAYDAGICPTIATDVDIYLNMTLIGIGDELNLDPVLLLAAIAKLKGPISLMDERNEELRRKDGEEFSDYVARLLG